MTPEFAALLDGEKPPPAGDALEDMRTSIRAFHSRAGNQVLHGAGEKNLPGVGAGGYAGTDVQRYQSRRCLRLRTRPCECRTGSPTPACQPRPEPRGHI